MNDVWNGVLILMRTASFIAAFPPWAGRQLPQTVKVGLAVTLSIFWALQPIDGPLPAAPDGFGAIAIVSSRTAFSESITSPNSCESRRAPSICTCAGPPNFTSVTPPLPTMSMLCAATIESSGTVGLSVK